MHLVTVSWTKGCQPSRLVVLGMGLWASLSIGWTPEATRLDMIKTASAEDLSILQDISCHLHATPLDTEHVTLDGLPGMYISHRV